MLSAVDRRWGPGDAFEAIETIGAFADRIARAKGAGTNIELFTKEERVGGNGPNFCNGLLGGGVEVECAGLFGNHPIFNDFRARVKTYSVGEPGLTEALEFRDGKIMLGYTTQLDAITYENLVAAVGEQQLFESLDQADLVGFMNWTMSFHLPDLLKRLQKGLKPSSQRLFFFDICDPAKRTVDELRDFLHSLKTFRPFGRVVLSLNRSESEQARFALSKESVACSAENILDYAKTLGSLLDVDLMILHLTDGAAGYDRNQAVYVEGPICKIPKITTGGGDIFNAGCALGLLQNLPLNDTLTLARNYANFFVSTAELPTLEKILL
ncbi:MAG: hypothetical protein A2Y14_03105 [Verrucomicrobia bacterium GWF2_51_19]|nr:MAG: hypothetical protein A2Y14_03105 [Verrucomicrobia bacterium GWF2_51_19]